MNNIMCSDLCPCDGSFFVPDTNPWFRESLTEMGRCKKWDFSGKIQTYQECIEMYIPESGRKFVSKYSPVEIEALQDVGDEFKEFAEEVLEGSDYDDLDTFLRFFEQE